MEWWDASIGFGVGVVATLATVAGLAIKGVITEGRSGQRHWLYLKTAHFNNHLDTLGRVAQGNKSPYTIRGLEADSEIWMGEIDSCSGTTRLIPRFLRKSWKEYQDLAGQLKDMIEYCFPSQRLKAAS